VVKGTKSTSIPLISGVPQGSVLEPCLFLFYINDITDELSSTVWLFADDTMIYLAIKSEADADKLVVWEQKWMMGFHPKKCEVITVTKKHTYHLSLILYKLHGHILKHLNAVKYLGVKISYDLRWDKHIDTVTAKANSTLGFVRWNIKISSPVVKEWAYKTLVRLVLEYAQTVWDKCSLIIIIIITFFLPSVLRSRGSLKIIIIHTQPKA